MSERFNPAAYGPAIVALLADGRLAPLGPGRPNRDVRPRLDALSLEQVLAPHLIVADDMAHACLAGLWLYHDFLDESHTLSQDIDTPTGSYWHAILHRREPDASNAAYWFRRVGNHPVFGLLAEEAQALGLRLTSGRWDPFVFIELCEKHRKSGTPEEDTLRRVQRREWELLFDFSYRAATGQP